MNTHELEEFLAELSEISNRFRIGITGEPILFCLEEEDELVYRSDDESVLSY